MMKNRPTECQYELNSEGATKSTRSSVNNFNSMISKKLIKVVIYKLHIITCQKVTTVSLFGRN